MLKKITQASYDSSKIVKICTPSIYVFLSLIHICFSKDACIVVQPSKTKIQEILFCLKLVYLRTREESLKGQSNSLLDGLKLVSDSLSLPSTSVMSSFFITIAFDSNFHITSVRSKRDFTLVAAFFLAGTFTVVGFKKIFFLIP